MTYRIGIISDTHGLMRPEAERSLAGVNHIVHGGDIGGPDVIAALRRIAPVTAIKGNVDTGEWAREYAETQLVRLGDRVIFVVHDLKALRIDPSHSASTSSSPAIPMCRKSIRSAAYST